MKHPTGLTATAVAILLVATSLGGCLSDNADLGDGPESPTFPATVELEFVRENTISTSGNSVNYKIQVPDPVAIGGVQEVLGVTKDPGPTREYTYKDASWSEWEGSVPDGGEFTINITYVVRLHSTSWEVGPSTSGDVADVPSGYEHYLGTEWLITPEDPQVVDLAASIVGSETDVYTILLRIYEWMDENIDEFVQNIGEPRTCAQTIDGGAGDSDDQAILFASLARAAGVPAWLELGFDYSPGRDDCIGICWNNVLIPLDDGGFLVATVNVIGDHFLFRDPYSITDYVDDGDGEALEEYYVSWSFSYRGTEPTVTSDEDFEVLNVVTDGSVDYDGP